MLETVKAVLCGESSPLPGRHPWPAGRQPSHTDPAQPYHILSRPPEKETILDHTHHKYASTCTR